MTSAAHASVSGDEGDVDSGELSSEYFDAPLQLSDIMPKNRRLYDKMRPPKYKGKNIFNFFLFYVKFMPKVDTIL